MNGVDRLRGEISGTAPLAEDEDERYFPQRTRKLSSTGPYFRNAQSAGAEHRE